jgi:hypothetical protein
LYRAAHDACDRVCANPPIIRRRLRTQGGPSSNAVGVAGRFAPSAARLHRVEQQETLVNRPSTMIKVLLLALPLALAYGCGTTGGAGARTAAAPDRAEQALAAAQSAMNEAKAARAAAEAANAKADQILATVRAMPTSGGGSQEALQASRAAQAAAEDAKRMALQAQDAVERLDLKTDRMFEKSMRK